MPVIESIVTRIAQWGFECRTVGINVLAADPTRPTPEILVEIQTSDCLIAIATPRDPLVKDGLWTAPEWVHGEVGIGFGREKPILVIYDSRVRLGGLPAQFYSIAYDAQNLNRLRHEIDAVMPLVRDCVRDKKSNDFWWEVLKGLGVVAVGSIAYQAGVDDGRSRRAETASGR